jgi:hypothetical protein
VGQSSHARSRVINHLKELMKHSELFRNSVNQVTLLHAQKVVNCLFVDEIYHMTNSSFSV